MLWLFLCLILDHCCLAAYNLTSNTPYFSSQVLQILLSNLIFSHQPLTQEVVFAPSFSLLC